MECMQHQGDKAKRDGQRKLGKRVRQGERGIVSSGCAIAYRVRRNGGKVEDKVQGHIRKSDESMPVMYEDVENAFSRVREKESDIKTVEMKYREEMEMKQAELKMLKEVFVDAREEKPQVVKCKEVSTRLNEVLDTAIFAMKEIQEEMPKYNRLFLEEDPESEKRRLALSRVFKRARERLESESAAGTTRSEAAEARSGLPANGCSSHGISILKTLLLLHSTKGKPSLSSWHSQAANPDRLEPKLWPKSGQQGTDHEVAVLDRKIRHARIG